MAQEFRHLFSPIKIGTMTVPNRIYSSPHHPLYTDIRVGLPNERIINYWVGKARGGVGMIGTYLTEVHALPERDVFCRPGAVDAFRMAADAVHRYGAKFICQVAHSGGQGSGATVANWAPSAIPVPNSKMEWHVPHEMTVNEVKETVAAYARAAAIAKTAGCDGVGIHGAHGYLVSEFMSPYFNRRTDEYGGSLENRMRFPLEIINAVRDEVGEDFVVGMRANAEEFVDGGYTLDDFLQMAPMLAGTGKLDFLNISVGTYISTATVIDPMYFPIDSFVYCAAAVKQVIDIPVIARGRITDPVQAEKILANNQADMVSMVRANIADPDFANKAREGRVDDIRKCLGCNEGCWRRTTTDIVLGVLDGITCTMNPAVGREGEPGWGELTPATVKKKVVVVGGGPAGLEAARVAALRGHDVSLYERGTELGGQALIAGRAPGREGFLDLGRYQTNEMKTLGVDVHLNTEITASTLEELAPDAIVLATGSVPVIPDIPGVSGENVVEARRVLLGDVEVGDTVVILAADDDIQSLSVADFLASQGKKVQVVYRSTEPGSKVEPCTRQAVMQRLSNSGVQLTGNTWVKAIRGSTVDACDVFTQEDRQITGVGTVVLACGGREDNALYYEVVGKVGEIHLVGDANGVRRINDATRDGAIVGRSL